MNGQELKEARLRKDWTQQHAAEKLGITQAYLSMVEGGRRVLPYSLARRAVEVLHARPTALPLHEEGVGAPSGSEKLRSELGALGYPGFAHLGGRARRNPAEVLLNALNESDVDTRVVEGLPWLTLTYADMDWDWLVQNAKLHDRQNRLGFVTTLAYQLGAFQPSGHLTDEHRSRKLKEYVAVLDRSRLVKEDTLCHDSLTEAERKWLRMNRPAEAAHWNLLTDMKAEDLPHGRL
jgi:transcriptional regulator with XRE-family HTH domain